MVGLAAPAVSSGAVHRETFFSAPIDTEPYEAEQKYQVLIPDGRQAPAGKGGWITAMDSDVVGERSGTVKALPIQDAVSYTHLTLPTN